MPSVNGDVAKEHYVVRLDSYATVNQGELVEADEATGLVRFRDKAGETKSVTLGEHNIRILRKTGR
jgi:hypothetical protein